MAKVSQTPTPYPNVNVVLHALLKETRAALGENFFGMYLYGSLASGDFDEHSSDVDFVIITNQEITADEISKLRALHERIAHSGLEWAKKLEGSYVPRAVLRRYIPNDIARPQYNEGVFFLAPHESDWIVQRYILRAYAVVVAGPPIQPHIDPVSSDELRGAVAGILSGWWAMHILTQPQALLRAGYQPYAVLTMCRALYCFEHGAIVSKPRAARWAMESLEGKWNSLIEHALSHRADTSDNALAQTTELIRYTVARAAMYRVPK